MISSFHLPQHPLLTYGVLELQKESSDTSDGILSILDTHDKGRWADTLNRPFNDLESVPAFSHVGEQSPTFLLTWMIALDRGRGLGVLSIFAYLKVSCKTCSFAENPLSDSCES